MLLHLTLTIIVLSQFTEQYIAVQNETATEETKTTLKLSIKDKTKPMLPPPNKAFLEYIRCRQFSSLKQLANNYSCPYDFDEDNRVCWNATPNGSYAFATIEYDHGSDHFYEGVRYGIANCTLQRFCHNNGTWVMPISSDIQCDTCIGDDRPIKFNSISIMIETMSLSLSLLSLTIAILCMINIKYVSYFYVKLFRLNPSDANRRVYPTRRPPISNISSNYNKCPLLCRCFLTFRRLHLPRNLLHIHLFLAFILRSIVKLVFIHLIIGGYTYSMIRYTRDKCGNIEIISKSSNLFHIIGCRVLASLFWYTDAVSQTFVFCEAMFLFTALTSHLFRDRGCTVFALWGWLSPLIWLSMWIASHILTDRFKHRSTCWLEADNTTYFYYFFYVPYTFYLFMNFAIFLFLVRLLYTKYRSNYVPANRTANRHLIKSIIILIPLFGLHSLFVMWVFHHKNQGHTIWYYIVVMFKAVFGDLQGFFTSLIYFYFNTEIRTEVLRQVQRTLSSNDALRHSSVGETLSTRLSVFRISLNRRRHSSNQNRIGKCRTTATYSPPPVLNQSQAYWRNVSACICPCSINKINDRNKNINEILEQVNEPQQRLSIELKTEENEMTPVIQTNLLSDDNDGEGVTTTLSLHDRPSKGTIDIDGLTCDTVVMKNENEELLSDANYVTIHQSSFSGGATPTLSHPRLSIARNNDTNYHVRSKSDGRDLKELVPKFSDDNKSLK
ncbi:unnamed protein product [Rotaria magnacalcarata]|uniref:Uncharacterized protein n=1 Tax=Rotaria magnacalcarata TaxID=392030 RepID=A0A816XI65_9BILA|nr:unnamed protein product [Rotaria magnacalcarata]CAF2212385.1 unnamed protein product [Rotaria magnacalcarata]